MAQTSTSPPYIRDSWFFHRGADERVQVVARRSVELAAGDQEEGIGGTALELLRVANHDVATLRHAIGVCRSIIRDSPDHEPMISDAIRLLERVITFLGARPAFR